MEVKTPLSESDVTGLVIKAENTGESKRLTNNVVVNSHGFSKNNETNGEGRVFQHGESYYSSKTNGWQHELETQPRAAKLVSK